LPVSFFTYIITYDHDRPRSNSAKTKADQCKGSKHHNE
jgi:hypothetical protein